MHIKEVRSLEEMADLKEKFVKAKCKSRTSKRVYMSILDLFEEYAGRPLKNLVEEGKQDEKKYRKQGGKMDNGCH